SRLASPVRALSTGHRVPHPHPPVPGFHIMALHPSSMPLRIPLPSRASSLADGPDLESDLVRAASPTVTRLLATIVTDPSFESAAPSALVAEVVEFAAACRLDHAGSLVAESESGCTLSVRGRPRCTRHPDPVLLSRGDYESLLLSVVDTMDAEMASSKSTGIYVDAVPPPGANIVDVMWIFRVKRPSGSPPVFKARYVARGFSQRQGVDFFQTFSPTSKITTLRVLLHVAAQRDYKLPSLDFSIAFLQGSLHEEIWLRRPPGFTGSFPARTQWSLRRPVYGLRQAPRKQHDTLRTTLAALGFAPSTADPLLFLRIDTLLSPFYILVYHGLQITRDRARRTITLTLSHMVHKVLQRFSFRYSSPQSTRLPSGHSLSAPPSDESVEPSGPYPEHVGCLISSCEDEIYAGAMAAQELRCPTYLLTDLGERPRSPPVLYVDNKAMIALCQEHRTKLIALRYFLARQLQQCGQLRLAYEGLHYNETFAPVTKSATLRTLLALAGALDLEVEQLDVKTAFRYGRLKEEVYMKQPPGFDDDSDRVCKLKRTIYGLKQCPHAWYTRIDEHLLSLGFVRSECDHALYVLNKDEKKLVLLIYVDDLLLVSDFKT
ncbi:unnamed protein product, partial [Closterium sp. NIES-54]